MSKEEEKVLHIDEVHKAALHKELENYLKSETAFTLNTENMKKLSLWLEEKGKKCL